MEEEEEDLSLRFLSPIGDGLRALSCIFAPPIDDVRREVDVDGGLMTSTCLASTEEEEEDLSLRFLLPGGEGLWPLFGVFEVPPDDDLEVRRESTSPFAGDRSRPRGVVGASALGLFLGLGDLLSLGEGALLGGGAANLGGDRLLRSGEGDRLLRAGEGDRLLRAGEGDRLLRAGEGDRLLRAGEGALLLP